MRRLFKGVVALCIGAVMGGCAATLPDVAPFKNATVEMRLATGEAYESAGDSARQMRTLVQRAIDERRAAEGGGEAGDPDLPPEDLVLGMAVKNYCEGLQAIEEAQGAALASIDGFLEYVSTLQGIADSAKTDTEKATAYADSVAALGDTVSGMLPVAGAPLAKEAIGIIASAAKLLAQYAIKEAASRSLVAALQDGAPRVSEFAGTLSTQLEWIHGGLSTRDVAIDAVIDYWHPERVEFIKRINSERVALVNRYAAGKEAVDPVMKEMERVEDVRDLTADWWKESEGTRSLVKGQAAATRELLLKTAKVVREWKRTHDMLVEAAVEGRQPSIDVLNEMVKELAAMVERVKEFRKKIAEQN